MSELEGVLAAIGVTEGEIEAARRDGTLLALLAERFLIPGERALGHAELASRSGVDAESLSRLWLALGFPKLAKTENVFTEQDVDVIRLFLSTTPVVSDYTLHEARVISGALARIAEVFIDEMWDQHFSDERSEGEGLGEMFAEPPDIERMERILMYLLRRHLIAAIYRRLALQSRSAEPGMPSVAIGFADVVGFTSMSQSLTASDLTELIVSFERTMFDLVASMGGRVIKTIGDEVMFQFDDASAAADFALRVASFEDETLPAVRVGLGWGPVLVRQGDCFGPTVNLASRVVGTANGGEVVVDDAMAKRLAPSGYMLEAIGERELKGFGPVSLWRLRAGAPNNAS